MPIFHVTITNNTLPILDASQLEPAFDEFCERYTDEIHFAKAVLKESPIGAQLHCHYQGKQLQYENKETDQIIFLFHTYLKIREDLICVKLTRKYILGAGGFGRVKLLFDIQTGERIAAKELLSKKFNNDVEQMIAKQEQQYQATRAFSLGVSHGVVLKARNPFKRPAADRTQAFGPITLQFVDEEPSDLQSDADKSNSAITKPFLYYQYQGKDLFYFSEKITMHDIEKLPDFILKLFHELEKIHKAGWLHLDVKLDNILIQQDSAGNLNPKFCDFDFALKFNHAEGFVISQTISGTEKYFSPEIWCRCSQRRIQSLSEALQSIATQQINAISHFHESIFFSESHGYQYTPKIDIYALGRTLKNLLSWETMEELIKQTGEKNTKKFQKILILIQLMLHYHPTARPDLTLMKLALLPICGVNETTLDVMLQQYDLPAISLENLQKLSTSLLLIGRHFNSHQPAHYMLLSWLYAYIQEKFITRETSVRDFVTFIKFVCDLQSKSVEQDKTLKHPYIVERCFFDKPAFQLLHKNLHRFSKCNIRSPIFQDTHNLLNEFFYPIMQQFDYAVAQLEQNAKQPMFSHPHVFCLEVMVYATRSLMSDFHGVLGVRVLRDDLNVYRGIVEMLTLSHGSLWNVLCVIVRENNQIFMERWEKLLRAYDLAPCRACLAGNELAQLSALARTIDDSVLLCFLCNYVLPEHQPTLRQPRFFESAASPAAELSWPIEPLRCFFVCAGLRHIYLAMKTRPDPSDALRSDICILENAFHSPQDMPVNLEFNFSDIDTKTALDKLKRACETGHFNLRAFADLIVFKAVIPRELGI